MKEKNVAKAYAKAIYSLGKESSVDTAKELTTLTETINSCNNLENVMFLDVFTPEEKASVINTVLDKLALSTVVKSFINFLLQEKRVGILPLIIKEVIADNMLQQCLMHPEQFDVVVTTNQNGDFLADMLSAQVGGVGIMPAANLNNDVAFFEPTHGTFERIAGQNKANPSSSILSAVLMLKFMGWDEAALQIENALEQTFKSGEVTFDLAQEQSGNSSIHNSTTLTCTGFAKKVIEHF